MDYDERRSFDKRIGALGKKFQKHIKPDEETLDRLEHLTFEEECLQGVASTAEDEPMPLSWRRPHFSDWKLEVETQDLEGVASSKTYKVHKSILGDGKRMSLTLKAVFEAAGGGGGEVSVCGVTKMADHMDSEAFRDYIVKAEDNTEHVTPFEMVLDFFYQGKYDPSDERMILPVFKLACSLKCQALFEKSTEALKKALGIDTAPRFLMQCIQLGRGLEKIRQACTVSAPADICAWTSAAAPSLTLFPSPAPRHQCRSSSRKTLIPTPRRLTGAIFRP